jgi:hypothetical protein
VAVAELESKSIEEPLNESFQEPIDENFEEQQEEPRETIDEEEAPEVVPQVPQVVKEEAKVQSVPTPKVVAPSKPVGVTLSGGNVASVGPTPGKTEQEKRAERAAKFGLPAKTEAESKADKLAARAARFGTNKPSSAPAPSSAKTQEEKKRARAQRFGTDAPVAEKGKKGKMTSEEIEKVKAARAMRFQLGTPGTTESVLTEMQEK